MSQIEFSGATYIAEAYATLQADQAVELITHEQVLGQAARAVRQSHDIAASERNQAVALVAAELLGESSVRVSFGCGEPDYRVTVANTKYRIDASADPALIPLGRRN